jgi:hypothetical protein
MGSAHWQKKIYGLPRKYSGNSINMSSFIRERLFIVGCPRLGTTLLQNLLASHSAVASFFETQFFIRILGSKQLYYWVNLPLSGQVMINLMKSIIKINALNTLKFFGLTPLNAKNDLLKFIAYIGRQDLKEYLPEHWLFLKKDIESFINILDAITIGLDKVIWVEKSPDHLYYLNDIKRFVPKSKFIHIIRNGPDVIASLYSCAKTYPREHWGKIFTNIDRCINKWISAIKTSKKHIGKEDNFAVQYEQLVNSPESVLKKLCGFIGVDFEKDMIKKFTKTSKNTILEKEQWKINTFKNIKKQEISKFYKVFDKKEQEYILGKIKGIDAKV